MTQMFCNDFDKYRSDKLYKSKGLIGIHNKIYVYVYVHAYGDMLNQTTYQPLRKSQEGHFISSVESALFCTQLEVWALFRLDLVTGGARFVVGRNWHCMMGCENTMDVCNPHNGHAFPLSSSRGFNPSPIFYSTLLQSFLGPTTIRY